MKDFSHYIIKRPNSIKDSLFTQICEDISSLIANSPVPVAGFQGEGSFIITEDKVVFNGKGEEACEEFSFTKNANGSAMNSTKTMALPYDVLVQSSLLVLKFYLGDSIEITTDGEFEDWKKAIGFTRFVLDIDIPTLFPEQLSVLEVKANLVDISQYKINQLKKELSEVLGKYTENHDICIK
jgi:hypothetical protein|tara:strand:+ start:36 stop:581 length:546 start_codon:yes stop_codon:yes gene_type:complete